MRNATQQTGPLVVHTLPDVVDELLKKSETAKGHIGEPFFDENTCRAIAHAYDVAAEMVAAVVENAQTLEEEALADVPLRPAELEQVRQRFDAERRAERAYETWRLEHQGGTS